MIRRAGVAAPRAVLLALALLAGCGRDEEPRAAPVAARAADAAPAIPPGAPLVVFLGDSITAGLHVDPEQAFPGLLQRQLAAEGRPFRLVNAGVSGDTTAGGLRRLEWLLEQRPDVFVVELGGNDGLRGQDVAEIEARLREILVRARASGARVLLLGMKLPPSLGADYADAFEALYARLAQELGVAFVPFFMEGTAGVEDNMQPDGIHPTRSGHARIAEGLAPILTELLEQVAPEKR